ncbi:MAG: hypothetical protein NWE89_06500 [Candidatus Bathyarchaeota archaeon]|nr:hypothetical protein [Candidatus Bathyarchaeota archaeon]
MKNKPTYEELENIISLLEESNDTKERTILLHEELRESFGNTRPEWCIRPEDCTFCFLQHYTKSRRCYGYCLDPVKHDAPECDTVIVCTDRDDKEDVERLALTPLEAVESIRGLTNVLRGLMHRLEFGTTEPAPGWRGDSLLPKELEEIAQ